MGRASVDFNLLPQDQREAYNANVLASSLPNHAKKARLAPLGRNSIVGQEWVFDPQFLSTAEQFRFVAGNGHLRAPANVGVDSDAAHAFECEVVFGNTLAAGDLIDIACLQFDFYMRLRYDQDDVAIGYPGKFTGFSEAWVALATPGAVVKFRFEYIGDGTSSRVYINGTSSVVRDLSTHTPVAATDEAQIGRRGTTTTTGVDGHVVRNFIIEQPIGTVLANYPLDDSANPGKDISGNNNTGTFLQGSGAWEPKT